MVRKHIFIFNFTDSIYASTDVHNQYDRNYETIVLHGIHTVTVKTPTHTR